MNFTKTLSRNEMKNISGGYIEFTDEYGCDYNSTTAGCKDYYNCLSWVCAGATLEAGWGAADCVNEVQILSLSCGRL